MILNQIERNQTLNLMQMKKKMIKEYKLKRKENKNKIIKREI